jgi:hypothetical protein
MRFGLELDRWSFCLRPGPVENGWQDARWQRARSTCGGAGTLAADLSAYSTRLFDTVECHRRHGPEDWPKLIDEGPQNLIEGGNPGVASNTKRLHLEKVPG